MRSSRNISLLRGKFAGEELHVIGSGPSLAKFSPADIGPGPVVAINYAIRTVEKWGLDNPVFSMQKDQVFLTDIMAPILAHAHESAQDSDFGDYVFDCEADFNIAWQTPSIVVCLYLANWMGCKSVQFHCCDSFRGNLASYDGQETRVDYRAAHYILHPALVYEAALKIGMKWSAD